MITLSDTPVLTTERLVLRAPQAGDWPVWRDFAASERSVWVGGPLLAPGLAWRAEHLAADARKGASHLATDARRSTNRKLRTADKAVRRAVDHATGA